MMYSLWLYERLSQSTTTYRQELTRHIPDWTRTTRAIGGYWMGSGTITADTMTASNMAYLYNTSIGRRIVEDIAGITTWEGEIVAMTLTIDGVDYTRSMDTESWHNKVKVRYAADETAYTEITDSSDIYGESVYIDILGGAYDATSAAGRGTRRLADNAYPRSRPSGGLAVNVGGNKKPDQLRITCGGYVFSMNRRYQELDIAATAINTQISTLVGYSEFVTAGRIDPNATTAPVSTSGIPFRLWNLIEELIEMGDSSGNRYAGGVYDGRKFHYGLAESTVTHYWQNGRLVDKGGVPVPAPLVKPDIIVEIAGAPFGSTPPGGNIWDKPNRAYISEVEFIAPNGYQLITSPTLTPSRIEPYARAERVLIPQFIQLQEPLTSVAWDGDSFSTTAKTLIDLSSVFSAPSGIRAIDAKVAIRDSGSSGASCYIILGPTNTPLVGKTFSIENVPDDIWRYASEKVPCDANGDIYYQIAASGASTMDVLLEIWGYWL